MNMRFTLVFLALLLALGLIACPQQSGSGGKKGMSISIDTPLPGTPIAKIGNYSITKEDFEKKINRLNPYIRKRYQDPARMREYLDNLIRTEVLAQEALQLGYGDDPQIIDRVKSELSQRIINEEFDNKMRDKLVTEEDVKKYYDDHLGDYEKPPAIRLSHIFFAADPANKKDFEKAKAKAEKALKEVLAKDKDYAAFSKIATENSEDQATKPRGGDLNYMSKDEMVAKFGQNFADVAYSLTKNNETYLKLVESKIGLHIVKMRGKRDEIKKTYDQMKSPIRSRLYYDRRTKALSDWVADVSKKHNLQVFDDRLKEVKIDLSDSQATSVENPKDPEKAAHHGKIEQQEGEKKEEKGEKAEEKTEHKK
jgi:hypothetical protein